MAYVARERQILDSIRSVCEHEKAALSGRRVVLFGSRAGNNARTRSDFDIGIDGLAPLDPASFDRLFEKFEEIDTLYRIDLVDLQAVSDNFRSNALQKCKVIYE
jgi:predicted nucleotidyltransferase